MHYEGLDSRKLYKFWYNHHKLQVPWSSLSKVTTTGYQQFNELFCKWVHPYCVWPTFSECLVWITIWSGLFSSVTEKMLKMIQKSKRTVLFTQKKIHEKLSVRFSEEAWYWEKKNLLKRSLRGKRTKKAFLVILVSHFFPWKWKLWKNEELNSLLFPPSVLGAKGGIKAVVEAGQKISRSWRSACESRKDWIKLKFCRNFYYSERA